MAFSTDYVGRRSFAERTAVRIAQSVTLIILLTFMQRRRERAKQLDGRFSLHSVFMRDATLSLSLAGAHTHQLKSNAKGFRKRSQISSRAHQNALRHGNERKSAVIGE